MGRSTPLQNGPGLLTKGNGKSGSITAPDGLKGAARRRDGACRSVSSSVWLREKEKVW